MKKLRSIQYIYHLADERNWQSIQADGLMSATTLLEKNKLNNWIFCHRHDAIELNNGSIIRDQRPMPPSALQRCLMQNLTPADWYGLLNQRIFFWIVRERLERQRLACASPQYILTIDAQRLLKKYSDHAAVTPFNTGNARRAAARRCLASFVPYKSWQQSAWASEAAALGTKPRLPGHKPVELTITSAIPDILDFVLETEYSPNTT